MPSRELAAFLAEAERGAPGGILRAGVGIGGQVLNVYDPWLEHVESARGARRARASARAARAGRSTSSTATTTRTTPGGSRTSSASSTTGADFEPVARFTGIESEFVFRMLRYTGRERSE